MEKIDTVATLMGELGTFYREGPRKDEIAKPRKASGGCADADNGLPSQSLSFSWFRPFRISCLPNVDAEVSKNPLFGRAARDEVARQRLRSWNMFAWPFLSLSLSQREGDRV
jgi:hypothetical protein